MKLIFRILLLASMGAAIILLIPPLAEPILSATDTLFNTDFTIFFAAFYETVPDRLMTLAAMQISTLGIIIILRFILGGKPR